MKLINNATIKTTIKAARDLIVRNLVSFLFALILAALVWARTTSGIFLGLPVRVDALEQNLTQRTNEYSELIDMQEKINRDQLETNNKQELVNKQILKYLDDIQVNQREMSGDIKDILKTTKN